MTLAELDAWLAWQIAGVYHHPVHSALRCTPLAAWERGVERMRKPIKEPSDPKRFYWDFLPFEQRLVTRHGIQLFNILYWQGALGTYVRDGDKHFVRYDPSNLSRVYLLERGGSYLEIEIYRMEQYPFAKFRWERADCELSEHPRKMSKSCSKRSKSSGKSWRTRKRKP